MHSWLRNASFGTWLLAAALLVSPVESQAAKMFDFKLVGVEAAETEASVMRPDDNFISFYNTGTVLSLELPTDVLGNLITGVATLSSIAIPNPINESLQAYYFELNNVPASVAGTLTVNGNDGELDFPSFQIGFRQGTSQSNAQQGSFDFLLSSGTQNVANCGGRGGAGQDFSGSHIDIASLESDNKSGLSLMGVQCPYSFDAGGSPIDEIFRLSLQGTIPEPGTGLLLGFGLTALGIRGRRRTQV